MRRLPSKITVDERGCVVRYQLPRRRPGQLHIALLFVVGIAVCLILATSVYLVANLVFSIALGGIAGGVVLFMLGHGEVTLNQHTLVGANRYGPFRSSRIAAIADVQELRIVRHVPRIKGLAPTNDGHEEHVHHAWHCDLLAILEDGRSILLIEAYPAQWVHAIAHDLHARVTSQQEGALVVTDQTGWSEGLGEPSQLDRISHARDCIIVPPPGMTPDLSRSLRYLAFLAIVTTAVVASMLYVCFALRTSWLFFAFFVALLMLVLFGCGRVLLHVNRAASMNVEIATDGEAVLIKQRSRWSSAMWRLERHEVSHVTVGDSGVLILQSIVQGDFRVLPEIHIHLTDGRFRRLLLGHSNERLIDIAAQIRALFGLAE